MVIVSLVGSDWMCISQNLLSEPSWSREETDHLMDLCKRFDLRFTIVADRFNQAQYQVSSCTVESLSGCPNYFRSGVICTTRAHLGQTL